MSGEKVTFDFNIKQYYHQSNLVYKTALIAELFLIPFFWATAGFEVGFVYLLAMVFTVLAIIINQKKRYGLASLIFILTITASSIISFYILGPGAGFSFYFFNLSVLIVFTNWKKEYKLVGIILEIIIFMISILIQNQINPLIVSSPSYLTHLQVINALFNIAGVANSSYYYLKIAKAYHMDILQLANTDQLTSLANRNSFVNYYDEIKKKIDTGLGVLMIDVDKFKNINDTYGHLCGDYVLKQIANIFISQTKPAGMLARYGGEEFVYIFGTNNEEEVEQTAENLRKAVAEYTFSYNSIDFNITISIGAIYRKPEKDHCNTKLLTLADELLYESKERGRNLVTFKII